MLYLPVLGLLFLSSSIHTFRCPGAGLHRDPSNCSAYYSCWADKKELQHCPPGLVFNPEGFCDWPANVDCGGSASSSTSGDHVSSTVESSSASTHISSTSSSTHVPSTTANISPSSSTTVKSPSDSSTSDPATPSPSSCSVSTDEPISADVKKLRQSSCTASNEVVSSTSPGLPSNPPNVRLVEAILPEATFTSLFPRAHASYTYDNFLKAVAKFPGVCTSEAICRKTLAVMFAHFQQETAGLVYLREINRGEYCARWSNWVVAAYPCSSGQKYYGRGAKQLSWNYNYGAFSTAMFGDTATLLDNPDLVADTWLNFASAFWFLVTPQPPKPSILQVIDGSWVPNSVDKSSSLVPGLGATTMVINGAMECGPSPPNQAGSNNRQNAYKEFAAALDVDISGEKLGCEDMEPFSSGGAANPAIYWDHTQGCGLVNWQTAYSALVPGDYARCKAMAK